MSLRHALFALSFLFFAPASALEPGEELKDCESCPAMIVIPAGTFTMGSPVEEEDRQDSEGPAHEVAIARNFAVGKFEVTVEEYLACVAANGCREPEWREPGNDRNATTGSNNMYKVLGLALTAPGNPIVGMSWDDAQKYVSWLSQVTAKPYRLLSEAE